LVLCDIGVPIMSGFELLERLMELAPRLGGLPPFVFLTALSGRDDELRARRLGADDYVTKPVDFDILEMIIKARLAGVARTEIRTKLADLNDREIETLTWVARGKTSAQIAEMLGLAKRTVDFHLDNARNKLGAATRTEAVIKAAFGRSGRTAFGVAGGIGVVDVQILKLGRKRTRHDELKTRPCRPIESDALRLAELLADDVLSYVADRDAAGHVRQKTIERIPEPQARG
jgi:FixJ family two-component response regulator